MSAQLVPRRIADDVLEYQVGSSRQAQSLAAQLRALNLAEDVVAGLTTVSVRFDPHNFIALEAALGAVTQIEAVPVRTAEPIELAIRYGGEYGPDLAAICASTGLSETAFVEMHSGQIHTVEMIGFTPGFSYMSGLPNGLSVPRLSDPRPRVPAGSVGISSEHTGIYALPGPGGWPLIGQVWEQLFDPEAEMPFRLLPQYRVRFRPV